MKRVAALLSKLPAVLLSAEDLPAKIRWRLTDSLFEQIRPLVEGCAALLIVLGLCLLRTGRPIFGALAAAALGLLAVRLWVIRCYWRRHRSRSPRYWTRRFLLGGAATGAIWGFASSAAFQTVPDAALRTVVLMVQCGWVAGVGIRNAASPATVWLQSSAAVLPSGMALLLSGDPLYQFSSLFFLLQLSANGAIARYLGRQMLSLLSSEQALAVANAKLTGTCAALEQANLQLQCQSATDGLTGIGNRRAFDAALATEWARALREPAPLSLLMVDVDWFKRFNDRYGHPAGDDCLRRVAATLRSAMRDPPDFAGRFGGEEFVLLLPGIDQAGAEAAAERLRCRIVGLAIPHEASPFEVVTVSIGAATLHPNRDGEPAALIELADRSLYDAKRRGRNRVLAGGEAWLRAAAAPADARQSAAPRLPAHSGSDFPL